RRHPRADVSPHRGAVRHVRPHRAARRGHRFLRVPTFASAQEMGIASYSAYLTLALGALAAVALWFGRWPVAALALAFLVAGRREAVALAAGASAVVGIA